MRIISKFHDYYDSALAFGHDDKVTFVREQVEYKEEYGGGSNIPEEYDFLWKVASGFLSVTFSDMKSKLIDDVTLTPHTVAFCGKVYRGVIVTTKFRTGLWKPNKHEFFYDADSLATALGKKGVALLDKVPVVHVRKPSGWFAGEPDKRLMSLRYKKGVDEYFREGVIENHRDFFIEKKVAIAAWHPEIYDYQPVFGRSSNEGAIIINPELAKFQFYKVFHAYAAFQELDMFLGGVLSGEDNPMAGIEDEDLAKAKGYDCMSFRKEPSKRNRKRCK